VKTAGSNPAGVTNHNSTATGMWCRGLTCDPVKVETAGSNPVIPATDTAECNALGGRVLSHNSCHFVV
jgi:hypothetical protein